MKFFTKKLVRFFGFLVGVLLILLAVLVMIFIFNKSAAPEALLEGALYLDKSQPIEARVADLLSVMTIDEKIGQMALVEKRSLNNLSDINTYHLGALLSGSGSKPETNTALGWRDMILSYQQEANTSRLGIPLLYGVDAVHGHGHVPGMTIFPHSIGLGASMNESLVSAIARATAEDLNFTEVNWNFSPDLDQPADIRWGRVYETFSDDPKLVSRLGAAYVSGLQEKNAYGQSVLATPKHFVGLGNMQWNSSLNKNFKIDQGVVAANEQLLQEKYLPPFAEAIDSGALSIMVGLNIWGDKKMVLQKHLLTDVLKTELGFKGFLVSDWYGVHEGRIGTFWPTVQAVNAGVDMLMLPFDYEKFVRDMKWANRLGLVSDKRIDDAVGRILYAKFTAGLFDNEMGKETENKVVPLHRELAREAVSQSMVLLKNSNGILPIVPKIKNIRVAGSAADNVGQQMGGWSVEWQGIDGNLPENSTSILQGILENKSAETRVEYNQSANFGISKTRAEIGIAVVGEKPYSEGWGDNENPTLSEEDLLVIDKLKESCDQVVVIIVSGRPLLVTQELDSMDALVAAWLPGSEGAGVADVLFGKKPFTGKLPLPWPSSVGQLPIASDGSTADGSPVLFARYFGL